MPGLKRKATKGAYGSKYKRRRSTIVTKRRKFRRPRTKFARAVKSVILRNMETKEVFRSIATNVSVRHNVLLNLDDNAFYTYLGTRGEDMSNTTSTGSRVGKEIFLKGIKVALMIESMQMRPQVTYWLYLIRNNKNPDTGITSKSDVYEGKSSTIPLDYLDTDKCRVMFCKKITLRMPNTGTTKDMPTQGYALQGETGPGDGMGGVYAGVDKSTVTNPKTIQKFYVPVNKKVMFRDDADGQATLPIPSQRYQWIMVAYDNYSTDSSVGSTPDAGHVHMTTVLKFKDI